MKTGRKVITAVGIIILVLIPLTYYYPKWFALLNNPTQLSFVFLSVSGLASFSVQLLLINLGIFISAALIDLIGTGWEESALRRLIFIRDPSSRGDLWCWILSVFSFYDFFVLAFSFGLFYVLSSVIVKTGGFNLLEQVPTWGAKLAILLILGDLKHFLWHRLMHVGPLWELHKYHHSATHFNLITNGRGHFIEKGVFTLFDAVLFSLLGGISVAHYATFLYVKEFYDQLLHSNLNWSLGWFGKYVFISPKTHRIHHSQDIAHYDKNFGTMFIFWDKLFGTYLDTNSKIEIGVKENPYTGGFWFDMVKGTRNFLSSMIAARRTH